MLRESSDTRLRTQQLLLVRQHDATHGLPRGVRLWGQISNRHISETVTDNPSICYTFRTKSCTGYRLKLIWYSATVTYKGDSGSWSGFDGRDLDHGQLDLVGNDRFHPCGHLTKFGTYKFNNRRMVGQPWTDKVPYTKYRHSNHP